MDIDESKMKYVFSYLEKEMAFQGAASTLSLAAGAWLLKEIAFQGEKSASAHSITAVWVAAGLLLIAGALFLFQRGQLSRSYGVIARDLVLGIPPAESALQSMVRRVSDPSVVRIWWLYYAARTCLLLAGLVLLIAMSSFNR